MNRTSQIYFLSLAMLGACAGGTETGNPAVPTPIGLSLYSSDPQAVAVNSGNPSTLIEEAWVAFGEFQFLSDPQSCAMIGEIDVQGPTLLVVDLAAADDQVTVELEPGDYCGLLVPLQKLTPVLPDAAPAELSDHSVVLRGRRSDGTEFQLNHPQADELDVLPLGDVLRVEAGGPDWLLSFDVALWMQGVDLDAADVGADGRILIDGANNVGLLNAFEENAECSLGLYADDDDTPGFSAGDSRLGRCPLD